nr:nTVMVp-CIBN-2A-CRY2-cTVMVp [Vector 4m_pSin-nTVMVp-CIBN-2A-CRY2-cTVMVp]
MGRSSKALLKGVRDFNPISACVCLLENSSDGHSERLFGIGFGPYIIANQHLFRRNNGELTIKTMHGEFKVKNSTQLQMKPVEGRDIIVIKMAKDFPPFPQKLKFRQPTIKDRVCMVSTNFQQGGSGSGSMNGAIGGDLLLNFPDMSVLERQRAHLKYLNPTFDSPLAGFFADSSMITGGEMDSYLSTAGLNLPMMYGETTVEGDSRLSISPETTLGTGNFKKRKFDTETKDCNEKKKKMTMNRDDLVEEGEEEKSKITEQNNGSTKSIKKMKHKAKKEENNFSNDSSKVTKELEKTDYIQEGRGSLLTCGDVEENPGPMKMDKKTIVWFRRDLRIEDNPALAAAAHEGSVFPVFIWCPEEEGQFYPGRASRWWMKQSLAHLSQSLKALGSDLTLIKTHNTISAILDCIRVTGATKVVFNHLYDPVSLVRDHTVKEKLVERGISVQSYNGDLLYEPWEIYCEKGKPFTSFNSYWKKCLDMSIESVMLPPPWRLMPITAAAEAIWACSIEELGLENEAEKPSNALLTRAWSPGWSNADKLLNEFIEKQLIDYAKNSKKVVGNSTSLLSPYLHFGEISVRHVFQCARMKQIIWARDKNSEGEESADLFLRGIGLREYSRYICFNFPFTHEQSLLSHLRFFPWDADVDKFKAWRQGRTGYPLVDAGMRELWATGWMHNRIRVIVSSFAVKFLLLPWKWGMKYFWDTLLDADLECDILGWQYISGSIPDGHELDRLDNPALQGAKYDPEGEYIRQWLPELARLPTEWIHHPWDAPLTVLKASGVELGTNYAKPIVDIDTARELLAKAISRTREAQIMIGAAGGSGSKSVSSLVSESSHIVHKEDTSFWQHWITTKDGQCGSPLVSIIDGNILGIHSLTHTTNGSNYFVEFPEKFVATYLDAADGWCKNWKFNADKISWGSFTLVEDAPEDDFMAKKTVAAIMDSGGALKKELQANKKELAQLKWELQALKKELAQSGSA